MQNTKKGFTLIELLIVIGILAILVAAVVVVLNPAQLLAQARDGQRMSDMDSIRSAVNLYLATVNNASLTSSSTWTALPNLVPTTTPDVTYFSSTTVVNASTVVTGSGWVPVNLSAISGGSPLAKLPIDPTNSGAYVYGFAALNASSTYKMMARLESAKYMTKMNQDGGNQNGCVSGTEANCWYEVGSDVTGL